MVVALIALTGLVTLGGLTVLSVQGGIAAAGNDRQKSVALYAAESGAAAAMVALRQNIRSGVNWTPFIQQNPEPLSIPGNGAQPGEAGNLFSTDMNAWYEVVIVNNREELDPYVDGDSTVIIRSTGHGPNGTAAQIEWKVSTGGATGDRPCPSYGQKGMAEDGAGRNDCLAAIVTTDVATYTPGGS